MRPNENKMSDGGRDRASLGVKVWKSFQKWSVRRSAVRSIAWLGLSCHSPQMCDQESDRGIHNWRSKPSGYADIRRHRHIGRKLHTRDEAIQRHARESSRERPDGSAHGWSNEPVDESDKRERPREREAIEEWEQREWAEGIRMGTTRSREMIPREAEKH
jgi:hypothetical protein